MYKFLHVHIQILNFWVNVTLRPKRVYSICNCRGVYEHQVSHCGILEMKIEIT